MRLHSNRQPITMCRYGSRHQHHQAQQQNADLFHVQVPNFLDWQKPFFIILCDFTACQAQQIPILLRHGLRWARYKSILFFLFKYAYPITYVTQFLHYPNTYIFVKKLP